MMLKRIIGSRVKQDFQGMSGKFHQDDDNQLRTGRHLQNWQASIQQAQHFIMNDCRRYDEGNAEKADKQHKYILHAPPRKYEEGTLLWTSIGPSLHSQDNVRK